MKMGFERKQKKNLYLNINNKKYIKSQSKPIFANKTRKNEEIENIESPISIFENRIPKKTSMIFEKKKKFQRKRYGTFQESNKVSNLNNISKISEIRNFENLKKDSNRTTNFVKEKNSFQNDFRKNEKSFNNNISNFEKKSFKNDFRKNEKSFNNNNLVNFEKSSFSSNLNLGKFQKNSLNNFGNFQKNTIRRNCSRISGVEFNQKINLKNDINSKINVIQELRKNNKFLKEVSKEKIEEFLKKIKFDIKSKIFDKIVKSSLHFIYKHYENYQKSNNSIQILQINLRKQKQNSEILNKDLQSLKTENKNLEKKFLRKINQIGLLKKNKEIITNIKKNDVLSKIENLKKNQEILKNKIEKTKQYKGHQIYKIKCNYEKKGREEMKAKAIILALKHIDHNNYEHFEISEKVKYLLRNLEERSQVIENLPYQKLLVKKESLLKKLNSLKNN